MSHAPHDQKRSWKAIAGRTVRGFMRDQCMDAAAALTYFGLLSVFPMAIAIFALLGVFGQRGEVSQVVLGIVDEVAPDTADALRGPIEQLAQAPGAGLALVMGVAVALWSASGYVGAFGRAMNRIHGVEEERPFWKLRPLQLLITVIMVVSLTVAGILLVVSGDIARAIGRAVGASEGVQLVWSIAKWPVLLLIVVFLVALLYYTTPNVPAPRLRWIRPGALLAIVALGLATLAFGVYIQSFSNYDRTYGSLAGIVVFLLWLWLANLALMLGAEFDVVFARARSRVDEESSEQVAP